MIAKLFENHQPFAIGVSTIYIGNLESCSYFLILPMSDGKKYTTFRSKKYRLVETRELNNHDIKWLKENKRVLRIASKCDDGIVLEPEYGFREHITKIQNDLF